MKQPWHVIGSSIFSLYCVHELRATGESVVIFGRQKVGQKSHSGPVVAFPPHFLILGAIQDLSQRCPTEVRSITPNWRTSLRNIRVSMWHGRPSGLLIFGVDDSEQAMTWAHNHQGLADVSLNLTLDNSGWYDLKLDFTSIHIYNQSNLYRFVASYGHKKLFH
jgi:hypothetical protein